MSIGTNVKRLPLRGTLHYVSINVSRYTMLFILRVLLSQASDNEDYKDTFNVLQHYDQALDSNYSSPEHYGRRLNDHELPGTLFTEKSRSHTMTCVETALLPPSVGPPTYVVLLRFTEISNFESCVERILQTEDPNENQMIVYSSESLVCELTTPDYLPTNARLNCYSESDPSLNTCHFGDHDIDCLGTIEKTCYLSKPGEILYPAGADVGEIAVLNAESIDACYDLLRVEMPTFLWPLIVFFLPDSSECLVYASREVELQTEFGIKESEIDANILTCAYLNDRTLFPALSYPRSSVLTRSVLSNPVFSEKSKSIPMMCYEASVLPPDPHQMFQSSVLRLTEISNFESCVERILQTEDPNENQMIVYSSESLVCELTTPDYLPTNARLNCYSESDPSLNTCHFGDHDIDCLGTIEKTCYLSKPGEILYPTGVGVNEVAILKAPSLDECYKIIEHVAPGLSWPFVVFFLPDSPECWIYGSETLELQTTFDIMPVDRIDNIITCAYLHDDKMFPSATPPPRLSSFQSNLTEKPEGFNMRIPKSDSTLASSDGAIKRYMHSFFWCFSALVVIVI
eukprot:GHVH01007083.1.p1 GENE.GHVH01007083.1~~GHVH01007083.1.p1  ORF type:complete len:571 (+),score=51.19 GHVH01007083.1:17-1729(+)